MPRYEYRVLKPVPAAEKAFLAWIDELDRKFTNRDPEQRSDVVREALGVEFVEKLRFLVVGRLPKVGCFHGEITRGVSATESSTRGVWAQDLGILAERRAGLGTPFYRRLEFFKLL